VFRALITIVITTFVFEIKYKIELKIHSHKVLVLYNVCVLQEIHSCWRDVAEIKERCLVLIKKTSGKDKYYQATELVDTMDGVHEMMRERQCFCPCFRRVFLYYTIQRNRLDILTLLLSNKHDCELTSPKPCCILPRALFTILKQGKLPPLLGEESSLTAENIDVLLDVMNEDMLLAIEYFYAANHLDTFRVLLSHDRDLTKIRYDTLITY